MPVALSTDSTRSAGIRPERFHFHTACGVTEQAVASAVIEQRASTAENTSAMLDILNYELSLVNSGLLVPDERSETIEPMVEQPAWLELPDLKDRIRAAADASGMTRLAFAERLGVTDKALYKWLGGGGIEDKHVQTMAGIVNVAPAALKYGVRSPSGSFHLKPSADLPDAMTRVEAMQVLDALPPEQRTAWLSYGHWLVVTNSEPGPHNPFGQVSKPKGHKPGTQ